MSTSDPRWLLSRAHACTVRIGSSRPQAPLSLAHRVGQGTAWGRDGHGIPARATHSPVKGLQRQG